MACFYKGEVFENCWIKALIYAATTILFFSHGKLNGAFQKRMIRHLLFLEPFLNHT